MWMWHAALLVCAASFPNILTGILEMNHSDAAITAKLVEIMPTRYTHNLCIKYKCRLNLLLCCSYYCCCRCCCCSVWWKADFAGRIEHNRIHKFMMFSSKAVDIFLGNLCVRALYAGCMPRLQTNSKRIHTYSLISNLRSYFDWIDWMPFFSLPIFVCVFFFWLFFSLTKKRHTHLKHI